MSTLYAAELALTCVPSCAGIRHKLAIPSNAFGLGRWGRIALCVRPSSLQRVPSAAASVSVVAGVENADARPAREPSELVAGTDVAGDRLNA